MRQSTNRMKFGGGSVNILTDDTILRGKADFITNIDYNNIVNNRLIFIGDEFIIEKTIPIIRDNTSYTYSNIGFNRSLYYRKYEINSNFQNKLIPNLGININSNNKISVKFSDGGWSSNNSSNSIYTLSEKLGIGITNPNGSLHIKDINPTLILEDNNNNFKFSYLNSIFSLGNDDKQQFKIHDNANNSSLYIDNNSITNISNIKVIGSTILSSNININGISLSNWLITQQEFATQKFVINNNNLTPATVLDGIGSNITNIDYKNITVNPLTFESPLNYNYDNNTVNVDLSKSGWTSNSDIIYSEINTKIGIGTSEPLGTLHIGSRSFNYNNDGTLIISKMTSNINNNNFKFGYDDNFNFTLGDYSILSDGTYKWTKQIYINNLAPDGSFIITNNGTVNIANSLNINSSLSIINGDLIFNKNRINYNLNIDNNNNFVILNNIFMNNTSIGIGTIPDNGFNMSINGNIKILTDLYSSNIIASNAILINLNVSSNIITSNINSSNINTRQLTSTNINNTNLIRSQNINANLIVSSNNLIANLINVNNITCSNNLTCSNNINIIRTLTANTINSTDSTINNNLISGNISVRNNLNVTSNIYTNYIISSIIESTNINSIYIDTNDIKINNSILCKEINVSTNVITNNIRTINFFSSNIDGINLKINNINTNNITVIDTLNANNINTSYIINNNKITTNDIYILNSIIADGSITSKKIYLDETYSKITGLNTFTPLAELHICNYNKAFNNTSIIISGITNSCKIGYTNTNDFSIGSFNTTFNTWNNQIIINNSAPANCINIKSSGNISIGNEAVINDFYRLNIDGYLNATEIYEKGVRIPNINNINDIVNTKLISYLTIDNATNIYPTKYSVETDINKKISYVEDLFTALLSIDSNIYTNEKRYPNGTINNNTIINDTINIFKYFENSNFYGFNENFNETIINYDNSETLINYSIYYSSTALNKFSYIVDKKFLFNYTTVENTTLSRSWGKDNYTIYYNTTKSDNITNLQLNSIIINNGTLPANRYYGDFFIIKFDFKIIISKFRFYALNQITNYKVSNAPSLWRCYGSNDGINWTIINSASKDNFNDSLNITDYIDTNKGYAYYEHRINTSLSYLYIGFIINKIVNIGLDITGNIFNSVTPKALELFKFEIYGKKKLDPLYVSSNVLNQNLLKYTTKDYSDNNLQTKLTISSPLILDNNILSIDPSSYIMSTLTNTEVANSLKDHIINYIDTRVDIWIREDNKIYYTDGTVGIGTTIPNPNLDAALKLNVNGNIISSNINVIGNIITSGNINVNNITATNITATKYYGDGSSILNINYKNINDANKPILTNLNNWILNITNNISNCYNNFNGNIGIGYMTITNITSKLSVNGNIHATGIINSFNKLQENGIDLIDKYLTISDANNNYFKINGGIITGSVGIGTTISSDYILNINGATNSITFIENGINIANKYLSIFDARNEYLSKNNGGIIDNNLFIQKSVSIGSTSINPNFNLDVNGSIYSSNNISCSNYFIEGGSNLIDKYLTIINANNNFFKLSGGTITGSIGIGTTISPNYSLDINGSLNANNLYINGSIINFTPLITSNYLDTYIQNYPTLTHLSNNYLLTTTYNNKLLSYSETGKDPNYLKLSGGGIIINDTTFSNNLLTSNIITSNLSVYSNINTNNLNTSNINNSNLITSDSIYSKNNIGIGTIPNELFKLNVNGSIYSSNDISCYGNIIETGSNLKDKYLTIQDANNNFLKLSGGGIIINDTTFSNNLLSSNLITSNLSVYSNINTNNLNTSNINNSNLLTSYSIYSKNNIGIGTIPNELFKLNVNGSIYSSNDISCYGNIIEGGSNLKDKYLSISAAANIINTEILRNEISNNQPNILKKTGFLCICSKEIILNNDTYYKHDINLSLYIKSKKTPDDINNYKIFGIKCFSSDGVYNTMIRNKPPNILQYDIYSSYDTITSNINICAIGFPSNYYLNKITAGDIFLLKTSNYNYISILSKTKDLSISCIISDFLF